MGKSSNNKKINNPHVIDVTAALTDTGGKSSSPVSFIHNIAFHILLITVVGLICYSNTFNVPFMFDDKGHMEDLSKFIAAHKGQDSCLSSTIYNFNRNRFVGYLTFAMNYKFGKLDVIGYHVVNLVIHLTNAIFVYFLVLLTFNTPSMRSFSILQPRNHDPFFKYMIAFFSGLLFVSHPIQTQAVTYIYQRFASLTAMFYLLSVVMYAKARLAGLDTRAGAWDKSKAKSLGFYLASVSSALLAMKTKETAITLPIIIVLYEFVFFKTNIKKKILILLPILMMLAIIPISIMGMHKPLGELLSDLGEKTRLQTTMPRWDYLMTQIQVITTYIRLIFLPVNQNLDYDYPIYHSLFTPQVFLSFLFLLTLITTAAVLLYKSRKALNTKHLPETSEHASDYFLNGMLYRLIAFGIFWFFITLSVESSIIPIKDVIFEHRVYLPAFGIILAIICVLILIFEKLFKSKKPVFIFLALATIALSGATYARNMVWHDDISMWKDIVKKSPYKARAYNNLGSIYLDHGRYEDAFTMFRDAMQINPYYYDPYVGLMMVYLKLDRFEEAITIAKVALNISPDKRIYKNLGLVYLKMNRLDDALASFNDALKIDPNDAEAYNDLSTVYRKLGKYDDAIRTADLAIKEYPDFAIPYYNLGLTYVELKKYQDAAAAFNKALTLDPGYAEAYNSLGGLYLLSGKYDEAKELFIAALKIDPKYVKALYNLGAVYSLQGNKEAAMKEYATLTSESAEESDKLLSFIKQQNGQ